MGFATARNVAMYTEARLGQLWQVLTPLLNAAVYYLIFGLILGTSRGVPNFPAFLITGIFIFNFTQRAFITTSRVMPDSLPLIRALPFPRACLPIGYVLIELEQLVMSMLVLIVIVLATGEPLTWYWLLAIPALRSRPCSTSAWACSWPGWAQARTTSASCCRSWSGPGCTPPASCSASRRSRR